MQEPINSFESINLYDEHKPAVTSDSGMQDVDQSSLKEQVRERYSQDTRFRKHLALWVMCIVPVWLTLVLVIVFFCAFKLTNLDSSVLITLLATTVNVLGLAYIVLKGIFSQR